MTSVQRLYSSRAEVDDEHTSALPLHREDKPRKGARLVWSVYTVCRSM